MESGSPTILHIAPQNFAGMPYDFVQMHRSAGLKSRLVTMYPNTLDFEEDICLNLSLPKSKISMKWRNIKLQKPKKYNQPANILEKFFFKLRDFKNKNLIYSAIEQYYLELYDIYHFDGGMDFFRDSRFALKMKKEGKRIVCCYFGSDLRTRGLFKTIDEISDLNLTVEFDHLSFHPNINYLFFPFDVYSYQYGYTSNEKLRIIHSPTNRLFKGTDNILKVINELKKDFDFEFLLIENLPRIELLKIKRTCDLAIDQVGGIKGGSGYGKNSIENLSMGLPTITEFSPEYLKFLPENPFLHTTIKEMKDLLVYIFENRDVLKNYSLEGRRWVEKYHSYQAVNAQLTELYKKANII
ncbi:MAG: glycosyltransferase [Ignavibacteria bacterium]